MKTSGYWKKRIQEEVKVKAGLDKNIRDEIGRIHKQHLKEIDKEISEFYRQYMTSQNVDFATVKKRIKNMDVQSFAEKARRYVEEKDFSPQANQELLLYNLKMKINRLEMLKYNIDLEMIAMGNAEQSIIKKYLNKEFIREMNMQAGILGQSVMTPEEAEIKAQAIINTPYKNATWSERVWVNQNEVRTKVAGLTEMAILRGKSASQLSAELRKEFRTSEYVAKRLAVTEIARMQTAVQKASYEHNGFGKYEFIAEPTACPICQKLDGKVFDVKEMEPGLNASPIHPWCRCSTAPSMTEEREELNRMLGKK